MLEFQPARKDFAGNRADNAMLPVHCSLLSDELTPVSAFRRLASEAEHAFLFESVVGGERIARYSFLSCDPVATLEARGGTSVVREGDRSATLKGVDPLAELEKLLARYRAGHPQGLPRFIGGAVGYAGYDVVRNYEKLESPPQDDRNLPDVHFCIYDQMVIFDHVRKVVHIVAFAQVEGADADRAYETACRRVASLAERLGVDRPGMLHPVGSDFGSNSSFESSYSQAGFERAVDRCKQYIRAGDAFQVVLSQRLSVATPAEPFDIYRALRVINPSPFMFYLKTPAATLVGSSPEILCRIEGRTVSTRPLAGTRPRGRTEGEDRGLEAELRADPKECAEHAMLVDLGRNDLGRICEPGSVRVEDLMSVERYSHVMHLCSTVSGTLAEGKTPFDAIRSVLPVGTVSGAPKIRAMQIIDELEPVRRGPYAGTVGYIDFAGNMDTCIALRTLVIGPGGDGVWRVDAQVGAGIVADSEPANEYNETLNKAKALLAALQMAAGWTHLRD